MTRNDRLSDTTAESIDGLLAAARRTSFVPDATLIGRIERALACTADSAELGSLHVARALAAQGREDASVAAEAACRAVPHLLASGSTTSAAFASAMAAVFLDQTGDLARAIEYAVDAWVLLDDTRTDDVEAIRASLALCGFLCRLSSFDRAVEIGRRAFDGARSNESVPVDSVAFTFGYVAAEAGHVATTADRRAEHLGHARTAARWLREHGTSDVSTEMLAVGLLAETDLASGSKCARDLLDAGAELYEAAAPNLVAWHRLVRGTNASRHGDIAGAITLLDAAMPGLEASADTHCLVRALDERSRAKSELGDLAGAYDDVHLLSTLVRGWQVDQVGRLAGQLVRRADLERTTAELRAEAARLTADLDGDVITGARSRRWLEQHLTALESAPGVGAVLMFDIDRFKTVNDTHGHSFGDKVLAQFSTLIRECTGEQDHVARFGGEEFVVIVGGADLDAGAELAERVRLTVAAHRWPGVTVTTSVGVASGELTGARRLLLAADGALLEAKGRGRNQTVVSGS